MAIRLILKESKESFFNDPLNQTISSISSTPQQNGAKYISISSKENNEKHKIKLLKSLWMKHRDEEFIDSLPKYHQININFNVPKGIEYSFDRINQFLNLDRNTEIACIASVAKLDLKQYKRFFEEIIIFKIKGFTSFASNVSIDSGFIRNIDLEKAKRFHSNSGIPRYPSNNIQSYIGELIFDKESYVDSSFPENELFLKHWKIESAIAIINNNNKALEDLFKEHNIPLKIIYSAAMNEVIKESKESFFNDPNVLKLKHNFGKDGVLDTDPDFENKYQALVRRDVKAIKKYWNEHVDREFIQSLIKVHAVYENEFDKTVEALLKKPNRLELSISLFPQHVAIREDKIFDTDSYCCFILDGWVSFACSNMNRVNSGSTNYNVGEDKYEKHKHSGIPRYPAISDVGYLLHPEGRFIDDEDGLIFDDETFNQDLDEVSEGFIKNPKIVAFLMLQDAVPTYNVLLCSKQFNIPIVNSRFQKWNPSSDSFGR